MKIYKLHPLNPQRYNIFIFQFSSAITQVYRD